MLAGTSPLWWPLGVALIALVYSLVGHGGASGYLALLALSPLLPREVAITALLINLVVAGTSFGLYRLARHFSWTLAWPLLAGSVPWAYLGARLTLISANERGNAMDVTQEEADTFFDAAPAAAGRPPGPQAARAPAESPELE